MSTLGRRKCRKGTTGRLTA